MASNLEDLAMTALLTPLSFASHGRVTSKASLGKLLPSSGLKILSTSPPEITPHGSKTFTEPCCRNPRASELLFSLPPFHHSYPRPGHKVFFTGSCCHTAQIPQAESGTRNLPVTKKAQRRQRKSGQGCRSLLLLLLLLSQPVTGP